MYVSFENLGKMLADAFNAGLEGTGDLKDQAIEEIMSNHKVVKPRELRVFSIEELRQFPVGTKFCHSLLGQGEIVTKKGVRNPFMKFQSDVTHAFAADSFPWNMPMITLDKV